LSVRSPELDEWLSGVTESVLYFDEPGVFWLEVSDGASATDLWDDLGYTLEFERYRLIDLGGLSPEQNQLTAETDPVEQGVEAVFCRVSLDQPGSLFFEVAGGSYATVLSSHAHSVLNYSGYWWTALDSRTHGWGHREYLSIPTAEDVLFRIQPYSAPRGAEIRLTATASFVDHAQQPELEPNDQLWQGHELGDLGDGLERQVTGWFHGGPYNRVQDTYAFTLEAPSQVVFSTSPGAIPLNIVLTLKDSEGNAILNGMQLAQGRYPAVDHRLAAGEYSLEVNRVGNQWGEYLLSIASRQTWPLCVPDSASCTGLNTASVCNADGTNTRTVVCATACAERNGVDLCRAEPEQEENAAIDQAQNLGELPIERQVFEVDLAAPTYASWFTFSVETERVVTLSTRPFRVDGLAVDTGLRLFDDSMVPLYVSDDGDRAPFSSIESVRLAPGTYHVQVEQGRACMPLFNCLFTNGVSDGYESCVADALPEEESVQLVTTLRDEYLADRSADAYHEAVLACENYKDAPRLHGPFEFVIEVRGEG